MGTRSSYRGKGFKFDETENTRGMGRKLNTTEDEKEELLEEDIEGDSGAVEEKILEGKIVLPKGMRITTPGYSNEFTLDPEYRKKY
eukprot:gnl/Chilomastix_caulleri/1826.p1 GENE.gnl/Chilomastix_caulleri/1826~~gnl/Chilomastix_caulleri/1826.p1  ORF type:complete len:86 (+),score=21.09 gnl/Chilomastix_caulleri/1826:130-387(+)